MFTRKSLLDALEANGFKGEATLENVKSFIASPKGFEVVDANGKPVDIDAVWNTKTTLKLTGTVDAPAADETEADYAAFKAFRATQAKAVKGKDSPHGDTTDANANRGEVSRFSIGNSNRKAYERKIRENRAAYDDVDTAECAGAWLRLNIAGEKGYKFRSEDMDICRKANVEFNAQLGGSLVPQEFANTIIYLTENYGVAQQLANVVPMSTDSKAYPRQTGIGAMTPITESSSISVTDDNFGNVTLTAKKYGILKKVTNELFNDAAINVTDQLSRNIAEAKAIAMDNAYFIGDGSSTYANQIGLISGLSSSSSYITATGAWSAITTGDFNKLMGSVEYVNPARLGFVCSRQFFAQVMQRLDKATSQFKPLADGNLSGQNATFLGYPVYFSQVLPTATASTSKCVYFGDFTGGSMIGDRSQLNIATSTDFYFDSDAIAIRGIARFAVAIHGAGRGETYGPICGLVTT